MSVLSPNTITLHQCWHDAQKAVRDYRSEDDPRRQELVRLEKNPVHRVVLAITANTFLSGFGLAFMGLACLISFAQLASGNHTQSVWSTPVPSAVTVLASAAIAKLFYSVLTRHEKIMRKPDPLEALRKTVTTTRNALFEAVSADLTNHDFHIISKDRKDFVFVTTDGVVTFITDGMTGEPTLLVNGSPILAGYDSLLERTDHVAHTLNGDALLTNTPVTFEQIQRHRTRAQSASVAQGPVGEVVGAIRDHGGQMLRLLVRRS